MYQPNSNNQEEGATSAKATRAPLHEANLRTRGRPRSRENRRRKPTSPSPTHTLTPKSSTRHMADGVSRRADSCKPGSAYMRHRVRRSWKEWENINASGQVLPWIREGVSNPFRHNPPPPTFNQGVSLMEVTAKQLALVDAELARCVTT
jgi:hypothetical protein